MPARSKPAVDALRIINELGRREFSDAVSSQLTGPIDVETWPDAYFDHNGDDRATALDALRVINELARAGNAASSELEQLVMAPIRRDHDQRTALPVDTSEMVSVRKLLTDAVVVAFISNHQQPQPPATENGVDGDTRTSAVDQLMAAESFLYVDLSTTEA